MHRHDGCAVRITESPDTRLFGSLCFETSDVATVPELCQVMIDRLTGMAEHQYYFTVYPGDHVSLKVIGAVGDGPATDEVLKQCELFTDFVQQFNWHAPRNKERVRFRLCQVHLLTPTFAAHMGFRDPVIVTPLWHLCQYPGL